MHSNLEEVLPISPPPVPTGEDQYRLLFDSSPQPMWIYERSSWRFLAVNQAAIEKYGYSRDEFLSMTGLDIRPVEDAQDFVDELARPAAPQQALRKGGLWRHRLKSGAAITVEILRSNVTFQGRDAELVVSTDVSARVQAERCLSIRYAVTRVLAESNQHGLAKVLQILATGLEFEMAQLWSVEQDGNLHVAESWRAHSLAGLQWEADAAAMMAGWPNNTAGRVCARGCAAWTTELGTDFGVEARTFLEGAGLRGAMLFPLRHRTEVTGVVVLFGRSSRCPEDIFELTEDLGNQIGQVMERMRTERALRQAEEDFRSLFHDAPVAYHEIDRNGILVRVNRAECEVLGWSQEEMIGRPVWEFVVPEEREESRRRVERKLAGELPLELAERTYLDRNGRKLHFEVQERLITDERGRIAGLRTAMLDISASRQAQQQIARQALLLEHVNDAIFALDPQFRVTYMNRAAERIYGVECAQALGQDIETVTPVRMEREERLRIEKEILTQGSWKGEMVHYNRLGEAITVESSGSLQYDAEGRPEGIVVIQRDVTERQRAADALRNSEERLKFAQRAAGVGLWDWDFKRNVAQYSDQAYALYGTRPRTDTSNCQDWQAFLHPDDRERVKLEQKQVLATGGEFTTEYRVIWPDGSVHWVGSKGLAILDSEGRPERMTGALFDITEQKRAGEQIRILTSAFEQSPVSIVITDLEGNIQYANPKVSKVTGYSLEELKGRNPRIFKSGEMSTDTYRTLWETIKAGEWRGVFHNRKRNGEMFWEAATICPIRDAQGVPTHYLAVKEDITARMEMEAALQHSERLNAELAAIVEWSDAAIISKDLDGKILTWNPGAERVYGYAAGEMIGSNIRVLCPAERMEEETGIAEVLRSGKRIYHLETVRRRKDGELLEILLTVSPIRDRSGKITSASHIAWDITERKRLERQLAQAQKLESIGQLAAGIAHEINTPIQYIGDNATFLEEAFRDLFRVVSSVPAAASPVADVDVEYLEHETPKAIQQMLEGVGQVARIVRAMKEFSHPGQVEKIPIDINRAIESTLVVSRNEWKYVADVVTDFDRELPLVPCVAGEFNQVMLNLIVNAAHAIAEVSKAGGGKGQISISTRQDGGWAEICVTDTGSGIPEAIRNKVFDPFFTTKPVGKGTGQGLAIAHTVIVRNHGGTIRFLSETGSGTRFEVRLPIQQAGKQ